jgi:hypothetical protein
MLILKLIVYAVIIFVALFLLFYLGCMIGAVVFMIIYAITSILKFIKILPKAYGLDAAWWCILSLFTIHVVDRIWKAIIKL